MLRSRILGVGSYTPPDVVTNDDLAKIMDTSDEWIRQRTGIQERRWVAPETATSDLALEAAQRALAAAKLDKSELDMIILATLSPDHEFPGTACFLQAKMDLPGIPALDVRQQCTGFIYGVSIADQFIRTGMYRKILVIGAEIHSKGLDKTTAGRDVGVLFGDGAGAVVMEACEIEDADRESHVLSSHLHADGHFARELWTKAPGMDCGATRLDHATIDAGDHYPVMNGKRVYINAVKRMPEAVHEALEANGRSLDEVDLFMFHQANLRINEAVAQALGAPAEKVFNTIQRFANTTAATIPIGLDEARKAGKLEAGTLVVCSAFGSGFTWGSLLIRW